MKTLIITDVRVYKINDNYYVADAFYRILERYSKKFVDLDLLTRIIDCSEVPRGYKNITTFCSSFINIVSIKNAMILKNQVIINKVKSSDFIIMRLPSLISIFLFKLVKKFKKKYLCEIMGCAWDALWNHGFSGKLIAPYAFLKMKRIVKNANYATYVTQNFLQNRYPCKSETIGVSNVNIEKVYDSNRYLNGINPKSLTLITAAAVDVRYKGQEYVIKGLKELNRHGINIIYYLAGGGNQDYLKNIAQKEGVSNQIIFLGSLPHDELIEKLKDIDIYIQPSLQEGLPRSVIEAMSCGCVCLGSTTAGIPELLNSEQIFKRRSVKAIVDCIERNVNYDFNAISRENIKKAREYLTEELNKIRYDFYDKIIDEMEQVNL